MAGDEQKKALEGIRNPLNDIVKGFMAPAAHARPFSGIDHYTKANIIIRQSCL
ncbi:MAG: hypothetical protein HY739_10020 [Desulfobacterales bacterium]|nr:hypothetical protein [Desulfobacterales bacterium]